jgi:cell division protein ZipA
LLVLGSFLILGILLHGIWVSRKNNHEKVHKDSDNGTSIEQEFQGSQWHTDEVEEPEPLLVDLPPVSGADQEPTMDFDLDPVDPSSETTSIEPEFSHGLYDDLGLGNVRVVSPPAATQNASDGMSSHPADNLEPIPSIPPEPMAKPLVDTVPEPVAKASESRIYASVVTQPKPVYSAPAPSPVEEPLHKQTPPPSVTRSETPVVATSIERLRDSQADHYQAPEPPPFLLKPQVTTDDHNTDSTQLAKRSLGEQAMGLIKGKSSDSVRKKKEPRINDEQMGIDFNVQASTQQPNGDDNEPQQVLVLNVKTSEDNPIAGAALLPMLLTLGFKFGEQDIFHRHVNASGKGPVLFSLANMFKPGNFDIDSLENFTTLGISLFMILPIEGDPHQVFNMMHNAARKIADEFSAQVYDGKRALLTKQSLQQYVEKIREFERQRRLNRR